MEFGSKWLEDSENIEITPEKLIDTSIKPIGIKFYDSLAKREMCYIYPDANSLYKNLICYKYSNGNWRILRKANELDIDRIYKEIITEGLFTYLFEFPEKKEP